VDDLKQIHEMVYYELQEGAVDDLKQIHEMVYYELQEGVVDDLKQIHEMVYYELQEGAVDDLKQILDMRREFESKGLTFYIHVDAAWGGYFASILHSKDGGQHSEVKKGLLVKTS
jgi:hypothetical protein